MENQILGMGEKEMLLFKENVDAWIKDIRAELAQVADVSVIVEENVGNTQHNYELIHELKDEMEELRREVNALKLIQLVSLRESLEKRH